MTTAKTDSSTELVHQPPSYLQGIPIYTGAADIVERTIERMMKAQSPEELLADPSSGGLRDHVGELIVITDVLGIMPSNLREGDFYLVFEATTGDGASIATLTTGSPYAAGRIVKLHQEGWLPRRVRVVELESTTNPGQSSLWIVDAPQTAAVPGEAPF